jgi:hypothetical protein
MKLYPTENIIFKVNLSEAEVEDRLTGIIEPKKMFRDPFRSGHSTKLYEGDFTGYSFSISRIINYRNPFLPQINGEMENEAKETLIKIRMRIFKPTIVWMFGWMFMSLVAFIYGLSFSSSITDICGLLIFPLVGILFGYFIPTGIFKLESKKSINDFKRVFEVKPI